MKTRLTNWGNSLAVRIPKHVAEAAKLKTGDELDVVPAGTGRVEIRSAKRKPTLHELVQRITPENLHDETDWGPPVGKEVW